MPNALKCGIGYKEFFHYTPKAIHMIIDAYVENKKEEYEHQEYIAWLDGMYVLHAIGCAFSKGMKYPDNPYKQQRDNRDYEKQPLTEEESIQIQKNHALMMRIAQFNFEQDRLDEQKANEIKDKIMSDDE